MSSGSGLAGVAFRGVLFSLIFLVLGFTRQAPWAVVAGADTAFLGLMLYGVTAVRRKELARDRNRQVTARADRTRRELEDQHRKELADYAAELETNRRAIELGLRSVDEARLGLPPLTGTQPACAMCANWITCPAHGVKGAHRSRGQREALLEATRGQRYSLLQDGHHCGGKYYASWAFCPVHGSEGERKAQLDAGAASVTPLKGKDVPPLEQLAAVAAEHGLPFADVAGQYGLSLQTYTTTTTAELARRAEIERLRAAEERERLVQPDPEPVPEEAYVPAGQSDLSSQLLEVLRDEVKLRGGVLASQQPRHPRFHWYMNAEWLAEVRKLRSNGESGRLLYVPRERVSRSKFDGSLYGYPVIIGDAFGVPELREP